jgi:hypothetical protein
LVRAVAEEGLMAQGLLAAGPLSGRLTRMGGTSVAAPIAARIWADQLARQRRWPAHPKAWPAELGLTAGMPASRTVDAGPAPGGPLVLLRPRRTR